jgi:hydrogenase/urease accessory protein HupE
MKSAPAAAFFVLSIILWGGAARAHEAGLSRGEYVVAEDVVTATLVFSRRDAASVPTDTFAKDLIVHGDDAPCPTTVEGTTPVEGDGVQIVVRATCPTPPRSVVVEAFFLSELPFGHRHLARAGGVESTLTVGKRTFSFTRSDEARPPPTRTSLFGMGVEHILTGYDHLVFLLGLLIVASRARDLIVVVTAFTIGHSISLALATLGVFVPSPRFVEPLIALSIVYVGIENLNTPRKRWRITGPFGLVHGFGFASALRELSLPRAELPIALALFNLGVEVGQFVVLAVFVPIVWRAQRWEWFRTRGVRGVSIAIIIAGFGWFAARLLGG